MGEKCSVDGCEREVTAKGMCSMHYQRQRRRDSTDKRSVGRPRQYDPELTEKYQGAPTMSVRMALELMEWVKKQGGSTWVRQVATELRELKHDPEFERWKERFGLDREQD